VEEERETREATVHLMEGTRCGTPGDDISYSATTFFSGD
jgi:hypothetical protein